MTQQTTKPDSQLGWLLLNEKHQLHEPDLTPPFSWPMRWLPSHTIVPGQTIKSQALRANRSLVEAFTLLDVDIFTCSRDAVVARVSWSGLYDNPIMVGTLARELTCLWLAPVVATLWEFISWSLPRLLENHTGPQATDTVALLVDEIAHKDLDGSLYWLDRLKGFDHPAAQAKLMQMLLALNPNRRQQPEGVA